MNRPRTISTVSHVTALLCSYFAFLPCGIADAKEEAKAAFMDGVHAFGKENYPGALAAFQKSYRIRKKASVLYNIGMCQKALYRYAESLKTFKKYLKTGGAIKPQRRAEVNEAMEQMQELVGKLQLFDAPSGSEVLLNGKPIGKTPFTEPILLDPGRHTIEIRKENYKPLRTDVTSASGAVVSLRAALTPAMARIKVVCEEEKGLVFVDGKTVGGCPFEGEVEPGTRIIAIEAPSKKRFEKQVEAVSGSSSIVSASLTSDPNGGGTATPVPQGSASDSSKATPAVKSTRRAWQELTVLVKKVSVPKEKRIAAIDEFLSQYTVAARYVRRAGGWRTALAAGVEPESHNDAVFMRTKKEYFSIRAYLGSYGGGARIDFSTRRWRWFYMSGFIAGAGGAEGTRPDEVPVEKDSTRFFGTVGLSLGVPINLGRKNHHEIRIGLGLAVGALMDYNYEVEGPRNSFTGTSEMTDYVGMSVMLIFVPEIYYVWHAAKRFALQAGFDLYAGPFSPDDLSLETSSDSKIVKNAEPAFNGFVGVRF